MEAQIAVLEANMKHVCDSLNELKTSIDKIDGKLDEHMLNAASRASVIESIEKKLDSQETRIKKLESSFIRLAVYVALSAGGVTLGIDKIISIFR